MTVWSVPIVSVRNLHNSIGVFQLINKNDGTPFDENDLEETKEFCHSLGDIVTVVSKVETLLSIKNVLGSLERVVGKTTDEMEVNNKHIEALRKNMSEMGKFIHTITQKYKY